MKYPEADWKYLNNNEKRCQCKTPFFNDLRGSLYLYRYLKETDACDILIMYVMKQPAG